MKIGYARTSTTDQQAGFEAQDRLAAQMEQLKIEQPALERCRHMWHSSITGADGEPVRMIEFEELE